MLKLIGAFVLMVAGQFACIQPTPVVSPPGYDLSAPQVIKLPAELDEISGIALKNGEPDTIYAQQDEAGKLFYFETSNAGELQHKKFGKAGDYEDLAILQNRALVLKSNGSLLDFDLSQFTATEYSGVKQIEGLLPPGEYESMAIDEQSGLVHVLCKSCPVDKNSNHATGYILELLPGQGVAMKETFKVAASDFLPLSGKKKALFKPSALAKNKATEQWFVLSSVNKTLVVADNNFKVQAVYPLKGALFSQPEGIAFDRAKNLYISNERGDGNTATILKFAFRP